MCFFLSSLTEKRISLYVVVEMKPNRKFRTGAAAPRVSRRTILIIAITFMVFFYFQHVEVFSAMSAPSHALGSGDILSQDAGHKPFHRDSFKMPSAPAVAAKEVREAIQSSWRGYATSALGADEVEPLTGKAVQWVSFGRGSGGVALTVIDSLDTLFLAGLKDEFEEAVKWVETQFCVQCLGRVSFFETTIRALGGLLAAYDLTGRPGLKTAAIALGEKLYFGAKEDTRRKIPNNQVWPNGPPWYIRLLRSISNFEMGTTELVTIASVQLEFRKLTEVSGDPKFEQLAEELSSYVESVCYPAASDVATTEKIFNGSNPDRKGLCPVDWMPDGTPMMYSERASIKSHGDSFYEYLLKQIIYFSDAAGGGNDGDTERKGADIHKGDVISTTQRASSSSEAVKKKKQKFDRLWKMSADIMLRESMYIVPPLVEQIHHMRRGALLGNVKDRLELEKKMLADGENLDVVAEAEAEDLRHYRGDRQGAAIKDGDDAAVEPWYILSLIATHGMLEHLSCFAGGLFALSAAATPQLPMKGGASPLLPQQQVHHHNKAVKELGRAGEAVAAAGDDAGHINHEIPHSGPILLSEGEAGVAYTRTCRQLCLLADTGLPPEDFPITSDKRRVEWSYRLRPEIVESYFWLYVLTGEKKYQHWAWELFQAIKRHLYIPKTGMYSTTDDVRIYRPNNKVLGNKMETFWIAETLKYMLLIFSYEPLELGTAVVRNDNGANSAGALRLPRSLCHLAPDEKHCLDGRWVLTTEAHPLLLHGLPAAVSK